MDTMTDLQAQGFTEQVPPAFTGENLRYSPLWPEINDILRDFTAGASVGMTAREKATDEIMRSVSDAAADLVRPAVTESMRPYQNNAELTNVLVGLLKERNAAVKTGFDTARRRARIQLILFSTFFTIWVTWQLVAVFALGT